jgi:hypothetical protein
MAVIHLLNFTITPCDYAPEKVAGKTLFALVAVHTPSHAVFTPRLFVNFNT